MRDYEFSTDTLQEYADPGCEYADPGCEMQPAQPLYRPAAPEETRKRRLYLKKLRLLRSSLLSLAVLMLLSAAGGRGWRLGRSWGSRASARTHCFVEPVHPARNPPGCRRRAGQPRL